MRKAVLVLLGLGLLIAGFKAPVQAATPDVYEVSGVAVDVTAETAAVARDKALADGHEQAFRRLLLRLTLKSDHDRLPGFKADAVAPYVQDFSIAKEKASTTRYLASLNFRFKRTEIRNLLMDYGFRFAETPSKPVLVLPVYREAGAHLLWDTPNPWRQAWDAQPPAAGLVPMILPLGDLSDIAAIGAEQAVGGDIQRLNAIAKRYGTDDSLVVLASRVTDFRGTESLEVTISRYGSPGGEQTLVRIFSAAPEEPLAALLDRAALEIMVEVEDAWKRDNQLDFGNPALIAVTIPVGGLADWLAIRQRLAGVASIRYTDVVLMSRSEVRANLHFVGSAEQLALALAQADLMLSESEQGVWTMQIRAGGG
jgi:uncharacterized protein DUF2066